MEEAPHVLVVDDDARLRALLARFLREHGFAVSMAADAREARALLGLFAFDLMVLDVMMPGESGLELAASLGNAPPMLMLSARGETQDRLHGLEAGVDDYLVKPFEPKELLLRIRAILRRSASPVSTRRVEFGEFVFDTQGLRLTRRGEEMHLTAAEAQLLARLAHASGQPVPREKLAEDMGLSAHNARSVDVQMARLRKKIEPNGRPRYLQTVRGAGYRLVRDVP